MICDPVCHCDVHKEKGCAHVDTVLCEMKTCKILSTYKNVKDISCPVCGYNCLGNGGVGCIDKPKFLNMK